MERCSGSCSDTVRISTSIERNRLRSSAHTSMPLSSGIQRSSTSTSGWNERIARSAPAASRRGNGQQARQQENLHEHLRGRPDDLDFPRPREDPRAFRVLFEELFGIIRLAQETEARYEELEQRIGEFDGILIRSATQLDAALLAAVIYRESKFEADAKSSSGAIGLMQLLPGTARDVAGRLGVPFIQDKLTRDPA